MNREISRLQGSRNRTAGEYFESLIVNSLIWYEKKGLACVEKTPEPMKPLGPPNQTGRFLACFTKAAQPDFKGTLCGGRSVVFEAKHTDSDRIEYSRLTDEQKDRLNLHSHMGACTFVLVSFGLLDFYRIPWSIWSNMKELYGRKYIKQTEIEPYRVQYIAGVIKLLEGIEL